MWLVAFGYGLGRLVPHLDGVSYAQFIGPGLMVSVAMWNATYESTYGAYSRMRIQNVYESMLMAPLTVGDVVLGDLLWCASRALIGSTLMLIVLGLFGLVSSLWAFAILPILFIEAVMFAALGLIATSLAHGFSFFNFYFSVIVMPMFFFAGALFPIKGLPSWVERLSDALPLTHAMRIARGLFIYGRVENFIWHFSFLLGFMLLSLVIACFLVSRRMVE